MGNTQATPSGLTFHSNAEQAARDVDLKGKNVIVTGANTGIGLETARVLAKHGAHVVIGCRDAAKAQQTVQTIKTAHPDAQIEAVPLDLASLASVRAFAAEFKNRNVPLHILVNNAGVMLCPYSKTEDGFEMHMGTNHFGHFLLTNLLIDELERGAPSRVVVVSSHAHNFSGVNFDDLQSEKSYSAFKVYAQSKTANILFAREFNKRFESRGIYANSLHPGVIQTDLVRHSTLTTYFYKIGAIFTPYIKNVPQGAATSVYVATAAELERVGGKYFSDCNEDTPKPYATDPELANRLWDISAELVGLNK